MRINWDRVNAISQYVMILSIVGMALAFVLLENYVAASVLGMLAVIAIILLMILRKRSP